MIRAAAYCRVSTDKEDQANSFASQQRYFREFIAQRPDWELYQIYADEGITGTSTKKRVQFNQMICDAFAGKFQIILTKEVSRFSRNILDTIRYTRELRKAGIAVEFVLDHINTMRPDAELYLSIMASMAQEESRKTSSRIVWGQTRQMEKGVVFGRSLLGYEVKGGKLIQEPMGAEIVRDIFHKYALEQRSTTQIAMQLNQDGIPTPQAGKQWRATSIARILKNEKYVGDLVQKKTYTPDYLTHEKKQNHGHVPLILLENHHEPIVSREIWNLAQERLNKNKHKSTRGHSRRYLFSGKIQCGQCGGTFVGRVRTGKEGKQYRRWSCATTVREGREECNIGILIRDEEAREMLKAAIRQLKLDKATLVGNVARIVSHTTGISGEVLTAVPEKLTGLINGEGESELFYRRILSGLTVYPSRNAELRLIGLSEVFHYK